MDKYSSSYFLRIPVAQKIASANLFLTYLQMEKAVSGLVLANIVLRDENVPLDLNNTYLSPCAARARVSANSIKG